MDGDAASEKKAAQDHKDAVVLSASKEAAKKKIQKLTPEEENFLKANGTFCTKPSQGVNVLLM